MHGVHFEDGAVQLCVQDQRCRRLTRFLVESILHELLRQQKVLVLLLPSPLALLVHLSVHLPQFAHLCLLQVLHRDVLQDDLTRLHVALVPLVFLTQEIVSLVLRPLQAFISSLETLIILRPVVLHAVIGAFEELARFLLLRLELVQNTFKQNRASCIQNTFSSNLDLAQIL